MTKDGPMIHYSRRDLAILAIGLVAVFCKNAVRSYEKTRKTAESATK